MTTIFPTMGATKFGEECSPSYPCVPEEFSPVGGLTKRELFAAMAMQGQLSGICSNSDPGNFANLEELAGGWVAAADALLAELAKEAP